MSDTFSTRYQALVEAGKIEADPGQSDLVRHLAALERRLEERRLAQKSSSLGWLFAKRAKAGPPLKGLYVYGEVGRGKTMLMDLFFEASAVERKRRAHFHEFMADVHERVHAYRQDIKNGSLPDHDPIQRTAIAIADETRLLCFDEFHVTDIADAMILGRLFTKLFELGVVMVATSNIAPSGLYKDGLNRALFLPFLALLEKHCEVVRLNARTDFRLEKLTGVAAWYVPPDAAAAAALDDAWHRLVGTAEGAAHELVVKGHIVRVPKAAMGVARFSFDELCAQPLAASDYLKIAHEFHTLIVDGIPVMDFARRNEAKRFIILIDTLYDHAVKLLASAEAPPEQLYTASDGYEANEFKRTASRLFEMRSQSYLGLPHGPRTAEAWSDKIVET
ncbi:MAG: cell division protein ZapE [Pseudolabrys sp.]|nr:cell division protein ZapE [Pseudolabrys sp.]MDP2297574.1 cell division protein ZapE [Pseudolabrys sp.]